MPVNSAAATPYPSAPPPLWSRQQGRHSERLDPERGDGPSQRQILEQRLSSVSFKATVGDSSGWNLFRKPKHSYEHIGSLRNDQMHSVSADADPDSCIAGFYDTISNSSTLSRLFMIIIPVEVVLWIPAIIQLTASHGAQIWGVLLTWWSAWLTVLWLGWWLSSIVSRLLPGILRSTIGIIAPYTRPHIDWIQVLQSYISVTIWTAISWIAFQSFIVGQQSSATSSSSITDISILARVSCGFFLCAALLLIEKVTIQWAAGVFHERNYAERIAYHNHAVEILATLYQHSKDVPAHLENGSKIFAQKKTFGGTTRGVGSAAPITTTVFRDSLSQLTGSSEIPADSPQAVIRNILQSTEQTQSLARRIFYSFVKPDAKSLVVEDIAGIFPSKEEADAAFALLDQDNNGDCTRIEVERSCLECNRQQLSIEHSMLDLDTAVGRLDNILMTVYGVVVIVIIAIALDAKVASVITGIGTLVLGTSWLIGTSLAEVLICMIFLFFKYPYDVGDMVNIDGTVYIVKEIRLLSTIFLDHNHTSVFAPNAVVNGKFISNIRRSPRMSEPFTFDVAYDTTFEQIEVLRERMLTFLSNETRDYIPVFDVEVVDFPEQTKMTLSVDIKYKSNIQQSTLTASRRNKWVCALKTSLADVKIFGPASDPNGIEPTSRRAFEDAIGADQKLETRHATTTVQSQQPVRNWNLIDQDAVLADDTRDVFGESHECLTTGPSRGWTERPSSIVRQRLSLVAPSPAAYT